MRVHPGRIVTVTIGGVEIAKTDAQGNLIYTCCRGKKDCKTARDE